MKELFGILSGLLIVVSQGVYIVNIWRGIGRPVQSSWLVWALVSGVMLASMYQAGIVNYQIAVSSAGTAIIFLLSLKFGSPDGWSTTDYVCITLSAIGLALWFVLNNPYMALGANIVAMLISCWPTCQSVYAHPERESRTSWGLVIASSLATIISLPHYSLATLAQPVSYMIGPCVILFLIYQSNAKTPH